MQLTNRKLTSVMAGALSLALLCAAAFGLGQQPAEGRTPDPAKPTAKPRGSQLCTCETATFGRVGLNAMAGCEVRAGGARPSS